MDLGKLAIATGVAISLGNISAAHATDLAMARPVLKHEIPSIVSFVPKATTRASSFRDPKLICNLAKLYATGQGVPRDDSKAFRLYQYAAINGVADAQ